MLQLIPVLVVLLQLSSHAQGWITYPCNSSLGVKDPSVLPDSRISASSQYNANHGPTAVRMRQGSLGWRPAGNDQVRCIILCWVDIYLFTGLLIEGNAAGTAHVNTFLIQFSLDNQTFTNYTGNGTSAVIFQTNLSPSNRIVAIQGLYIIARYFKIIIITWTNAPIMRLELLGCPQAASGVTVVCTATHMAIRIRADILQPLQASGTHLIDNTCRGTQVSMGGTSYYVLNTTLNGCGTKCRNSRNYITYYNLVREWNMWPGQRITRNRRIYIPFSCSYKSIEYKTSIGMEPSISVLYLSEHGMGLFPCYLYIYTNGAFTVIRRPLPNQNVLPVQLKERMYMQLVFVSGDVHLWIRLVRCWGSPTNNPAIGPHHRLIANGCRVDPTVILYSRSNPKTQRFSFEAFVLFKHHRYLFIHCIIRVCKGRIGFCAGTCPLIGKRGLSNEHHQDHTSEHIVSHGPFTVHDKLVNKPQQLPEPYMDGEASMLDTMK